MSEERDLLEEITELLDNDVNINNRVTRAINEYESDNMGLDVFVERNVYKSKYEDGYLINIIIYRDIGFRVIKIDDLFYWILSDGRIVEYPLDVKYRHPLLNINRKYVATLDGRVMVKGNDICKTMGVHKYAVITMLKRHDAVVECISKVLIDHETSYAKAGVRFVLYVDDEENKMRLDIEFLGLDEEKTMYLSRQNMEVVEAIGDENWHWIDRFS